MEAPNLDLLKSGDKAAWDLAFNWLWPTAFAVAKNKLYKSPVEAEDIAIQAITKLLPHVSKVDRVEELRAILAKITHDECVGYIRKQDTLKRGSGKITSLESLLQEHGDFIGFDDSGYNSDLIQLIMNLAEQLNSKEKLIFDEFHMNGLNYEEISTKHDIPKNSVGVYLKRALDKLRMLLEKKNEDYV